MSIFQIAIAQYPIEFFRSFDAFEKKLTQWVEEAASKGAKILVFPEYGSMELISLFPDEIRKDLQASVEGMENIWADYVDLYQKLSVRFGVHILASTYPAERKNRAMFFAPNGKMAAQDKSIMTRFERENWKIGPGAGLKVFDTELCKIGVAICYDSEFPVLVRGLVEAGAELILIPSCTDTMAGYSRIRIGAQARALENQCYVAQSPTVGEAAWSPATDINIGAAGLFTPPDIGFPENGIAAMGEMNKPGWVYGEINIGKVHSVRRHGQVRNHLHWDEQSIKPNPVTVIDLK